MIDEPDHFSVSFLLILIAAKKSVNVDEEKSTDPASNVVKKCLSLDATILVIMTYVTALSF